MLGNGNILELQKGILYRKTIQDGVSIRQLVLPSHYIDVAFTAVHNDVGHQGRDKTLWSAKHHSVIFFLGNKNVIICHLIMYNKIARQYSNTLSS